MSLRGRAWVYQLLIVAALAALAVLIIATTQANLERLGVDTGIDFLFRRAGFEISQKLIPYSANSSIATAFLVALINTLVLAVAAIFCATALGVLVGAARLSSNWLVSRLGMIYVETFRNVPALLQIFFWYFVVLRSLPESRYSHDLWGVIFLNNRGLFLPATESGGGWMLLALLAGIAAALAARGLLRRRQARFGGSYPVIRVMLLLLLAAPTVAALALGDALSWDIPRLGRFSYEGGVVLMPEFMALVVGLSVYHASYIAEIVRSGFKAVPPGQREAAQALGLQGHVIFRLVLFPQALRAIVPPLTTVYMNLFKGTSLAAAIAYPEVVSVLVGTVNNLVGQPLVIMAMTLLIYVVFSLSIAAFMNWYNRRIALTQR